jgi:hypothetical protein
VARERRTMSLMVADWCREHHPVHDAPCEECRTFLAYADARLDRCPYGEDKPTCANCPIHCYNREPREFARRVMRFAGPRMLLRHPVLAVLHLVDGRREVPHPMELRRERKLSAAAAAPPAGRPAGCVHGAPAGGSVPSN